MRHIYLNVSYFSQKGERSIYGNTFIKVLKGISSAKIHDICAENVRKVAPELADNTVVTALVEVSRRFFKMIEKNG